MTFEKLPRFRESALQIVCKVSEWSELFKVEPDEIERQIGWAHGWIDNNPRKAPKNVMRYLYNWMLTAQRMGSMRPRKEKEKPKVLEVVDMSYEEMVEIRRRNMGQQQ